MSENIVSSAMIKKTQETLGKFIKKPKLTEKLLNRPPFRFLHDIVNSIIKETGYFSGLYTKEELNSVNMKDRHEKIQFLQKLIDVIQIALNNQISSIRASKIVAGYESEKTNELLQAIWKIIEQKINLNEAIELVKTGKQTKPRSKVKNNESAKTLTENKNERKGREKDDKVKNHNENSRIKMPSHENIVQKTNEEEDVKEKRIKTKVKRNTKEKNEDKQKNITRIQTSIEKKSAKTWKKNGKLQDKTESKLLKKDSTKDDNLESVNNDTKLDKKRVQQESNENGAIKENENASIKHILHDHSKKKRENSNSCFVEVNEQSLNDQIKTPDKPTKSESRKTSARKVIKQKSDNNETKTQKSINDDSRQRNDDLLKTDYHQEKYNSSYITNATEHREEQQLQQTKTQCKNTKPEPLKTSEEDLKRQSTFVREVFNNESKIRQKISLRTPSVRPGSARPGAPKRRDKNVEVVVEPNQDKMAGINVKLERFGAELADDGDNLIIIEGSVNQYEFQSESKLQGNNTELTENLQGHLVQQIIETQKELIQTSNHEVKPETDLDVKTIQNRQNSAKQAKSLREIIQNLTSSINPLGKLMDFIPEDIDLMQLQLAMWRDAYLQAASELKKEEKITQLLIGPLKTQLDQLDANIKEYTTIMNNMRAKILANSHKFSLLLLEQ